MVVGVRVAELRQSHFDDRGVILILYDAAGMTGAELRAGDLILRANDDGGRTMEADMGFSNWVGGPGLSLMTNTRELESNRISLTGGPQPNIHIRDAAGAQTFIGATQLQDPQAGTSTTTSAATILLYNDGDLTWTAP